MSKCVAFLPRNVFHKDLFVKVGGILRKKYNFRILHTRELGEIKGEEVFQFDKFIKENWNTIDISYQNLHSLERKYADNNLIRALYCEREYNFFPKYFRVKPVSYEEQLKYLVGCFLVFEEWLTQNHIDCIISELLTGLPDSVLYAICRRRGIKYISVRSSKMLPGIITCNLDFDLPLGMMDAYKSYLENGIPENHRKSAESHISELRSKILSPNYMLLTGKNFKLLNMGRVSTVFSRIGKDRHHFNEISMARHPVRNPALWNIHRFLNIWRTKINESRWFCRGVPEGERYFLFPLQYEPEASTMVRAYPFSNQMAVIEQIAKALPLGVNLVVKEHRGNQGYRKNGFYRELQYFPNVKLVPREMDVSTLLRKCIGVITLTSRMGWEGLVLGKPVIAFGSSFWTSFGEVKKPASWVELKRIIEACLIDTEDNNETSYEEKLLAYAAAYISLTHEGNFVIGSEEFLSKKNAENVAKALLAVVNN
jgi:hypothetical protein